MNDNEALVNCAMLVLATAAHIMCVQYMITKILLCADEAEQEIERTSTQWQETRV